MGVGIGSEVLVVWVEEVVVYFDFVQAVLIAEPVAWRFLAVA